MKTKNKKIFITGGAGFIGTKLTSRLIHDNKIIIYDTLQRNSLKNTNLLTHPNLKLIKGDILDIKKLKKAVAGNNIIIHMAAIAGIDTVIKSPTNTIKVNAIGTYNLLEAIKPFIKNIERFIDFSTSEVYGSYVYKLDETDNTTTGAVGTARWTYAISKLVGEHISHAYYTEFGLPSLSLRPFNIYGPGQVGEGAIHTFIIQAIKGKDITVEGNGDRIRSWCYIDDMVDSILLCIEKKQAIGEVFNIGNPKGTVTVLSLAEKIKELSNSKSKIVFTSRNYVDVSLRIPSIEKAKKILGFNPKINLNKGIQKTINWYKKIYKIK